MSVGKKTFLKAITRKMGGELDNIKLDIRKYYDNTDLNELS
jgi:hypothetical protein